LHFAGSLSLIPKDSGSNAFTHSPDSLKMFTPLSGGEIVLSGEYLYPSLSASSKGVIIGNSTSFLFTQTHFASSVPGLTN